LTGFSKRKKAKIEDRRTRAKERDHQAHLDERRKVSPVLYLQSRYADGVGETRIEGKGYRE
jgi:ribosomal RNA-processing protein 17